jgi:hypothetical protein
MRTGYHSIVRGQWSPGQKEHSIIGVTLPILTSITLLTPPPFRRRYMYIIYIYTRIHDYSLWRPEHTHIILYTFSFLTPQILLTFNCVCTHIQHPCVETVAIMHTYAQGRSSYHSYMSTHTNEHTQDRTQYTVTMYPASPHSTHHICKKSRMKDSAWKIQQDTDQSAERRSYIVHLWKNKDQLHVYLLTARGYTCTRLSKAQL